MKQRFIPLFVALILLVIIPTSAFAATITVNTTSSQGALMYGGIGFLYGLATNTPNDAMITGLVRPQYTGQNAPNGGQHPDGYCNVVAPQAKRTGFKGVYICCQDIYAGWPYPNNGINDYLNKLDAMARTIVADPNRSFYIYNLLNEPDLMWYATSGTGLTNMCNDWKSAYQKVRSIDSTAKIMGPSMSSYNSSAYSTFFSFCQSNNVMPNWATWHELQDSFYTSWYTHYNHFRSLPGCSSIPIMINEYGRSSGDLGVPGNLIQHLAKYENSNVYGTLAYWTGHGTLNDLVANNNTNQQAIGSSYNQPTGAWYLYQWYGQMTGNQVAVTPPSQEGSLQGIASKDGNNVTILFGGGTATYDVNLVVQGLSGSSVNYIVYETTNTGRNTAPAPSTKKSGTATVSSGSATISVTGCSMYSAFKVYITPGGTTTPTPTPTPSGSYIKLRNIATNLYIDGMGRTSNGSNAGQWSSSTSNNQQWVLEAAGSYYRIKNRATGLYLDGMGSTSNGAVCGQWGYDSTSNNQQWAREAVGSYYKFKNRATGLYLDGAGRTSNGSDLAQYNSSSSTNQQWAIVNP